MRALSIALRPVASARHLPTLETETPLLRGFASELGCKTSKHEGVQADRRPARIAAEY